MTHYRLFVCLLFLPFVVGGRNEFVLEARPVDISHVVSFSFLFLNFPRAASSSMMWTATATTTAAAATRTRIITSSTSRHPTARRARSLTTTPTPAPTSASAPEVVADRRLARKAKVDSNRSRRVTRHPACASCVPVICVIYRAPRRQRQ